jgi:glutamine synthetase
MPTRSEVVQRCEGADIDLIRLVYVGNDGVLRGKVINADRVDDVLEFGINVPKTTQSFTSLDHVVADGRFAGAGEARLVPDPDSFQVLPYADRTAVMCCDMCDPEGDAWNADPRSSLRSLLADLSAEGYAHSVAFESEFSLVCETETGYEPADRSLGYSVHNMQENHDCVLALADALGAMGMSIESYVPEYGEGQQELVVSHAPALRAADEAVLFRAAARAVALERGQRATFLPKPFEKAGNGCHIHLSLWDPERERNLFYDADEQFGLSEIARGFVAGVLEHAQGLTALTAPTVMSYDRLKPGKWASAFACWGYDNREAAVRIPSARAARRASAARIEYKPADNTANPYLALLGLLAAGMDGVENNLEPHAPIDGDPATLSADERRNRGIRRLPESLEEALAALEDDPVLLDALGDDLATSYLEVKYDECEHVPEEASDRDLGRLLRAF